MSDASVLEEQQLYNYSRLIAALQARKWEAPKLRIANLSRDIVCLLTQGRTLLCSLPGVCLGVPRPSLPIANKSATIDKASRALAQPVPPSLSDSYRARADRSGVPYTTLHHRARGRRSIEEKAQSQQYLAPYEEDALVRFLIQLSDLGQPVRIKYIRFLAFCVTR
jgi:hypothetical protein